MGKTREDIILAAIRLIGQSGYEQVTMRQIASEVGVRGSSLYNHFASKEDILESALDYIDSFLQPYDPSPQEIIQQLERDTPAQILYRYVTNYQDFDDSFRMMAYRLLFCQQYSNERAREITKRNFYEVPVEGLTRTLDLLMEAEAIPPGDSRAMAELWSQTSMIYGMRATHDYAMVDKEEYLEMTRFFIQMAVYGVELYPEEVFDCPEEIFPAGRRRDPFGIVDEPKAAKGKFLRASFDLFSQHGYANVSTRQIAERVGVQVGSIYSHFGSKEEILLEICNHIFSKNFYAFSEEALWEALESGEAVRIFHALAFRCPAFQQEGMTYMAYKLLFREQYYEHHIGSYYWNEVLRDCSKVTAVFERAAREGFLPPGDYKKLATAYVYSMCALNAAATIYHEALDALEGRRVQVGRLLISMLLKGHVRQERVQSAWGI